jgi:hypothetical protein
VVLDEKVLAASVARTRTAAVASLLGDIFAEPTVEAGVGSAEATPGVDGDGLEAAHRQLLDAVLRQLRWTQGEFELAARRAGVMPWALGTP